MSYRAIWTRLASPTPLYRPLHYGAEARPPSRTAERLQRSYGRSRTSPSLDSDAGRLRTRGRLSGRPFCAEQNLLYRKTAVPRTNAHLLVEARSDKKFFCRVHSLDSLISSTANPALKKSQSRPIIQGSFNGFEMAEIDKYTKRRMQWQIQRELGSCTARDSQAPSCEIPSALRVTVSHALLD